MPRCTFVTRRGTVCRLTACEGHGACHVHGHQHDVRAIPPTTCSICIDPCNKQAITLQSCGHRFHKPCLHSWFRRNQLSCPNCRGDVTYEDFCKPFPRDLDPLMTDVHYSLAQLKAAAHTANVELDTFHISEAEVLRHMEYTAMICPPSWARKKLEQLQAFIRVFIASIQPLPLPSS
jgi:hypothetical protein